MKPDELLKKLASFEAKGQVISADSRRAAMNAISGKNLQVTLYFRSKTGFECKVLGRVLLHKGLLTLAGTLLQKS